MAGDYEAQRLEMVEVFGELCRVAGKPYTTWREIRAGGLYLHPFPESEESDWQERWFVYYVDPDRLKEEFGEYGFAWDEVEGAHGVPLTAAELTRRMQETINRLKSEPTPTK